MNFYFDRTTATLEFFFLRRGWNFRMVPGTWYLAWYIVSVYLLIDRTNVFQPSSLLNPTHFGDGTSCFSLKGENDWWDRGTCDRMFVFKSNSSPVTPMHFGDGTSCFSLKEETDWCDGGTNDCISYPSQTVP